MRRLLPAIVIALLAAAPARAADPGRWRETGRTNLPLVYYQGVTHSTGGDWFFDGVYNGLWRTNRAFDQTGAAPEAIPPDVFAREHYDHIGDLSFDRAGGPGCPCRWSATTRRPATPAATDRSPWPTRRRSRGATT